jgi:subtilisin family serine protease
MPIKSILLSSIIALSAVIAVFSIGLARPDEPATLSDSAALNKIAPWVIDHTADGAPAEFFIVLNSQPDLTPARQLSRKIDKGNFVYRTLLNNALITQHPLVTYLDQLHIPHQSFYIVNAILVTGDRNLALKLAARSDVARIEGNPWVYNPLPKPIANPSSPSSINSIEAGVDYIHAPQVWLLGYTGTGIVIGNQDTGMQWDHPALIDHYRGWNGSSANHDYNWHDSIHSIDPHNSGANPCGLDSPMPCDDYGHGTHTTGTAIGNDGANNQIGVAPGAKWIGCRNMERGYGQPSTYLECFQFFLAPYPVTGTYTQGNPALAPDITTNSWSCPDYEGCSYATLQAAVEAQRVAGIMTVAAATNDGPGCSMIREPIALYDASYTIGALNTGSDSIASFSSRGPVTIDGSNRIKPDLAAPGNPVRSSVPGNGYAYESGTSMATPHVAGAIALLWSADLSYKNNITATEQLLNSTAVTIATSDCSSSGIPNNVYGYGRLDILAAFNASGLLLAPQAFTQSGYASTTLTYTLRITNTSPLTDTFNFSASGLWTITLAPAFSVSISPGTGVDVSVTIDIPDDIYQDLVNNMIVTVTSTNAPLRYKTSILTTIAQPRYGLTLQPDNAQVLADNTSLLTYTLRLTNTGSTTNTASLTATSEWPLTIVPTTTPPIGINAGIDLVLTISIPLTTTTPVTTTVIITATSTIEPSTTVSSTLIVIGHPYLKYFPILLNNTAFGLIAYLPVRLKIAP